MSCRSSTTLEADFCILCILPWQTIFSPPPVADVLWKNLANHNKSVVLVMARKSYNPLPHRCISCCRWLNDTNMLPELLADVNLTLVAWCNQVGCPRLTEYSKLFRASTMYHRYSQFVSWSMCTTTTGRPNLGDSQHAQQCNHLIRPLAVGLWFERLVDANRHVAMSGRVPALSKGYEGWC